MAAFSTDHSLAPDTYQTFYKHFFECKIFERWSSRSSKWRLHCSGDIGCGKTTLAVYTTERLRKHLSAASIPVASIFALRDSYDGEEDVALLREFLNLLYFQLQDKEPPAQPKTRSKDANVRNLSISSIRYALDDRLKSLEGAMLVFDGLDRCSLTLQRELEVEFRRLQKLGLHVMVTSRHPLEPFIDEGGMLVRRKCDVRDHGEEVIENSVYWTCQICEGTEHSFDCCNACKEKFGVCQTCQLETLVEPNIEALNWTFGNPKISDATVREFLRWSLELEHGDLGLGSNVENKPPLPPLSTLGRNICTNRNGKALSDLIEWMREKSDGNISLARLRLDNVHAAETLEEIQATHDRLPANIVDLFDTCVHIIEHSACKDDREIGLLCLAAVADGPRCLSELIDILGVFASRAVKADVNKILRATNGLLILEYTEIPDLRPYHRDFDYYLMDNYNTNIMQYRSRITEWRKRQAQNAE